ncbi:MULTISPECIES: ABC transporter ATP-binding protein [Polaromonas]|uniref:ABC transporter ATP-binding protein n=1 Tax=Polaromonas aquatica TaxID=332657 RepID=A0ABW1TZQ6_9BURK
MSLFAVRDVSLRFGGVQAIGNVSFDVEQGEVFAIIGPNGAGKTSLLNVITRVFDPTSGSVAFEDQEISSLPRHMVVRSGIARTFQNIELFEGGTVLDNLLLGRHRFGHGSFVSQCLWTPGVRAAEEQSRAHVEDVIELLDLMPHRNSPVAGLPYGVRKVVELARALATQPRLLLLDEPASGLNPEETRELAFWIDDIQKDLGITVIMVEHDMSLVSEAADRVLCMNMGQVLALGTPEEVQADPAVITAYLGA